MFRRWTLVVAALIVFISSVAHSADDKNPVLNVWPGKVPGETKEIGKEGFREPRPNEKASVLRLENVSVPTLTVYDAPVDKKNGCAVIVAPGGGYNILAWDLEGTEVAEWLNTLGVTAFVLKYRVPKREGFKENEPPLMDAQRAVSLVRSKASDFGIDPARIGMLGFSAGGNLTAKTCLMSETRAYDKLDAIDEVSSKPDFGVLIYAAYLIDDEGKVRPELKVDAKSPPMFFAHALNDGVKPENSIGLLLALKAAGVPSELHLYDSGGHGFGLRKSEFPCHTWPARCGEWMAHRGLLKK
jgi:acetyl esterase/lipase